MPKYPQCPRCGDNLSALKPIDPPDPAFPEGVCGPCLASIWRDRAGENPADVASALTGTVPPGIGVRPAPVPDFDAPHPAQVANAAHVPLSREALRAMHTYTVSGEGPLPAGGLDDGPDVGFIPVPDFVRVEKWAHQQNEPGLMRDGQGPRWVPVRQPYPAALIDALCHLDGSSGPHRLNVPPLGQIRVTIDPPGGLTPKSESPDVQDMLADVAAKSAASAAEELLDRFALAVAPEFVKIVNRSPASAKRTPDQLNAVVAEHAYALARHLLTYRAQLHAAGPASIHLEPPAAPGGAYRANVERLTREWDKLQAFKDFVHGRLDAAGVPTHPDGPHSKEGCRVGDRLDLVLARPTEKAAFVAMLCRAGIGHGLRIDHDPPGESVQVENDGDDSRPMLTEFQFGAAGELASVHCYKYEG